MTEIINNSLVHIGAQAGKSDYLQIFNKKRKSRWDDNFNLCKNKKNKNLDIKNTGRKTRWAPESEKTFTPLPFTYIPEDMDVDDYEILIRKHRLDDLNRRIQSNDWENIDPDIRSPSPEPIYDSKTGHRLNTREVRTKEKYLKEKNSLIEELIILDKNYIPPLDYRPPKKIKKIYIKDSDNEKHKLVGLILGPGGVTQRELEKKSGCRISVRGKGSNWSNNSADRTYHDENEPLHVFLQADTDENIRKGTALIEPILDPFSEEHIKHKQIQKQAIAVMYGYQTDTSCENCGERHRTWACPQNFGNFTKAEVQCEICKDKSHPTRDCPERMNLIDKNEAESDLYKFIREIDEFKKNAEIPIIEAEIKPDDIRSSILFTGKVIEKFDDTEVISNQIVNKDVETERTTDPPKLINNNMIPPQIYQQNLNTHSQNSQQQPLNYKLPGIPILDNPNVIRAAPVNYFNNPNPFFMQNFIPGANPNTNYYGSVLNPYLNAANNFTNIPGNTFSYNRGLNLISSNFQGKIPMSYGVNQNLGINMMNYPRQTLSNFPAMQNYRMNMPAMMNSNLIRPNIYTNPVNSSNLNFVQPPEPDEPPAEFNNDDIKIDKVD